MKLEKLMLLREMGGQTSGLKRVRRDSEGQQGAGYDSCRQTERDCWKRCRLGLRDLVQGCDRRLRLSKATTAARASVGHNIPPIIRKATYNCKQSLKSQLENIC